MEVVLHRFDMLHRLPREAVATLGRERTYLEAMFTAPDEPHRLCWLTVQGAGGKTVESSTLDLDRQHRAYMDEVLVKGSPRRLTTQNVLAPDVIVAAIRQQQRSRPVAANPNRIGETVIARLPPAAG